jgi:hypothetical protein
MKLMLALIALAVLAVAVPDATDAQALMACSYRDGGTGGSASGDVAVCGPCLPDLASACVAAFEVVQ